MGFFLNSNCFGCTAALTAQEPVAQTWFSVLSNSLVYKSLHNVIEPCFKTLRVACPSCFPWKIDPEFHADKHENNFFSLAQLPVLADTLGVCIYLNF